MRTGTQERFIRAMAHYCHGALVQVEDCSKKRRLSPEQVLERRQLSAGVGPIYPLIEYAHELHIPDYVFKHPVIQEIEQLGTDFVLISNDILSYMKEEAELVPHNMVAAARLSGHGPQEAFDYVGNMLSSRYKRWEVALEHLPRWGVAVDGQVEAYIQGVANIAKANLNWR
ncbi:hypothetical protein JX265_005855 [Neoarthrinium moseri]|uniref:Terpene synthase n=1 Tax=Neoarthrinium moseri TaxID=1658444 RepID=A0A9P9WNH9_9PEZI|nr:hypothetical protein JX265_005855 [Neoarthrinium moseri]